MENTLEKEEVFTKDKAVLTIGVLLTECSIMGTNDSEIPALNMLIADVKAEKIDPTEAVKQARFIRAAKMEYR